MAGIKSEERRISRRSFALLGLAWLGNSARQRARTLIGHIPGKGFLPLTTIDDELAGRRFAEGCWTTASTALPKVGIH